MENINENVTDTTASPEAPIETEAPATETEGSEQVFTQTEVDSLISKAVREAVIKAKQKASLSSEERIASLEREILIRDNKDYTRSVLAEKGIDAAFAPLFFSEDSDTTDTKIKVFTTSFEKAVAREVEARLGKVQPMALHQSVPSTPNKRMTLSERQAQFNLKH